MIKFRKIPQPAALVAAALSAFPSGSGIVGKDNKSDAEHSMIGPIVIE
jgi:hypothetical protein